MQLASPIHSIIRIQDTVQVVVVAAALEMVKATEEPGMDMKPVNLLLQVSDILKRLCAVFNHK